MPPPVAAVERRIWRHDLESQAFRGWSYASQFNPENDRCPDTGRKSQRVFKVGFAFPLLLAALLVVTKKQHAGPFRTSHQPWVWNCVYGMWVTELVEVNGSQPLSLHHWSGETFSQLLCLLLKCPWACQGCRSKQPLSWAVWKHLVYVICYGDDGWGLFFHMFR